MVYVKGMNIAANLTLDAFVKESIGEDALQSLIKQCIGGNNNAKGNNHENYFAIYKLVKSFNDTPNDDIEISSQDRAFVDDLVVLNKTKNSKISYQLKDSKTVYWHKAKGISPYFKRQYKIDMLYYHLKSSETVLVLAQKNVFLLRSKDIPSNITSHTRCMYFPNQDSANKMLLENSDFKNEIRKLCVTPDQTDKLEIIVKFLMGAWFTHNKTEKKINRLLELAKEGVQPDFFKLGINSLKLDPQTSKILDKIDGMTYTIDNNFLNYQYGDFEGIVRHKLDTPEFKLLCDTLTKQQPSDAMTLFSILMGSGESHD
jgi:hypothetical protein|tara:strand:+ start:22524 stop:23468 length:945 start_codon:yes stop_codon:yes gene_type:complete